MKYQNQREGEERQERHWTSLDLEWNEQKKVTRESRSLNSGTEEEKVKNDNDKTRLRHDEPCMNC